MLVTALVFSAGSLAAALSGDLTTLLAARFVAGAGLGTLLLLAQMARSRGQRYTTVTGFGH